MVNGTNGIRDTKKFVPQVSIIQLNIQLLEYSSEGVEGESSNRYHDFVPAKELCTDDRKYHIQDIKSDHNQVILNYFEGEDEIGARKLLDGFGLLIGENKKCTKTYKF